MEAPDVSRWYVDVPTTYGSMAKQAGRSALAAVPKSRKLIVESATPEFDQQSEYYQAQELVSFAYGVAEPLLGGAGLPPSNPHVKLLFGSTVDATIAAASIKTTSLPVSVLGHAQSIGPGDGAFVVVAPTSGGPVDVERAVEELVKAAAGRLVVLVNPRMGNCPLLQKFDTT